MGDGDGREQPWQLYRGSHPNLYYGQLLSQQLC